MVLDQTDIKVKYAVKAFSDVHFANSKFILAFGYAMKRIVLYKFNTDVFTDWYENGVYENLKQSLQTEIGKKLPVKTYRDVDRTNGHCMYWAPKQYQLDLCAVNVKSTDTVFFINGVLYKQKYKNLELSNRLETFSFFHFQNWKRFYRKNQMLTLRNPDQFAGVVVSKEGVIPLFQKPNQHQKAAISAKNTISMQHLTSSYCLKSSKKKFPPEPPAAECKFYVGWGSIIVLQHPNWNQINATEDITLALTLQISPHHHDPDGLLTLAEENIKIWGNQPCVLLIHAKESVLPLIKKKFPKAQFCFIGVIFLSSTDGDEVEEVISRKALLNMAFDASPTRFVVQGLDIERGLILSRESHFFARRAVSIYGEKRGMVFTIPQFAAVQWEGNLRFGAEEMVKRKFKLAANATHDCDLCRRNKIEHESVMTIHHTIEEIWYINTERELSGDQESKADSNDYDAFDITFQKNRSLKKSLLQLGLPENEQLLREFGVSPLIMLDKFGPRSGMVTSDLVSEVEEFGGRACFNALKLVQLVLLGYDVNVLTGTFAMSVPSTRDAACSIKEERHQDILGLSSCDGCHMFAQNKIVRDIARDEKVRVAKASLIWDDLDKHSKG